MSQTTTILSDPFIQSVWILLAVIVIERLLPWSDKYHPLSLFRFLAIKMASKVNPTLQRTAYQRQIAGALAAIVLILPISAITAVLIYLAEFPQFFNGIVLLIALQFRPVIRCFRRIISCLKSNKKALARNVLSTIVLRETNALSPIGIAKAAIESLLLRLNHQFCAVILCYLVAGSTAALTYRLVFELTQIWNTKLTRSRYFGLPIRRFHNFIVYFPSLITAFCFSIAERFFAALVAFKKLPKRCSLHLKILAIMGGALQIQLSGPVYYQGQKRRFIKVGGVREVRFVDMPKALFAVHKTQAVLLTLILLFCAIIYAVKLGKI
jgi:adenosylcobinamide-phosphate synthase